MKAVRTAGGWRSMMKTFAYANEIGLGKTAKAISSKNTCKTCAYGMGGMDGAMTNEAGDKIQICKKSVQAQLSDVQKPIDVDFLTQTPIVKLKNLSPRQLERLGRLDHVLYKRDGDTHFSSLATAEALALVSERFMNTTPERTFFYASGRSSNESAFILHLFARLYGTNNVNNCSYYCHQASGVGMGKLIGTGTATVSLDDLKHADLIFVIGANPSSNHPRFVTELMECRRRGGHVIIINPVQEPGLMKFAIPSDVASMLTIGGSTIASQYITPIIGHDIHVFMALAHMIIKKGAVDEPFIEDHCSGYEEYKQHILAMDPQDLCTIACVDMELIEKVADLYANSQNAIFSWAMGITHHEHGVKNVEAIVNLAMLRGMLGREHAGLLPLRGHSNVQGIGSVGVMPALKEKIFNKIEENLKVKLPTTQGWDTMDCMVKAMAGEVDIAWIQGGNLYASNPDSTYAEKAINKIKTKIYLTTTLNQGHLIPNDGELIIFPVLARDEEMQASTQESMFNYVRMSEGGIKRTKNALSESEIIVNLASVIIDAAIFDFSKFILHKNIRKAMSAIIPGFEQLEHMEKEGKGFTIGDRIKHTPTFDTPDGKAQFTPTILPLHEPLIEGNYRMMSVRSEGQFNSIIYDEDDAWRGVKHRKVVFMNREDIKDGGFHEGQSVRLTNETGTLEGLEIVEFAIAKTCIMTYYPESNILINRQLDPESKTPAFKNTIVKVEAI